MREIKFRAWHNKKRKLFKIRSLFNLWDKNIWINEPYKKPTNKLYGYVGIDIDLMQYTGLKDKNGIDIYEGDILSLNGDIHTVGYQNGCFLMIEETISDGKTDPLFEYFHEYETDLEVIGNIYENPELLEEKHE